VLLLLLPPPPPPPPLLLLQLHRDVHKLLQHPTTATSKAKQSKDLPVKLTV
jgi:hypothetical protein